MADIHVISTTCVQPPNENQSVQRIELTPWDLSILQVDYAQRGLLFPKPTSQDEHLNKKNNSNIGHLKSSLSAALGIFFPFAGRLASIQYDDKTSSFYIDCNGSGVEFVHALADGISVADIIEPVYVPPIIHSFFPMNGVRSYEGISKPLLAVQVTELIDGMFMGFTFNHMVSDGTSFWHFVNTWSEISKSSNHTLETPIVQQWFLSGVDYPIRVPFSCKEALPERSIPLPLQEMVFHFTKEKIANLKAKANGEIGIGSISSLQALVGHLWRSIIRHRSLDSDQEIHCKLLVNMRHRLNPPLLQQYFGNMIQYGTATTTAGELLDHGLGWAAFQIKKMVALQTDEEAREYIKNWVKSPKLAKLGSPASNALIVGSSPRFNVYGNDFVWGRPIAVRGGPGNNINGKLIAFPGAEQGSVDIEACLSPETLQALSNDAEFMQAVTL